MKTFNFNHEPSFAELWDMCVHNLLYSPEIFVGGLKTLFEKINISKQSKIIDVAAGGGFPALLLIRDGYNILCSDGWADEIDLYKKKALEYGVKSNPIKILWKDLEKDFPKEYFDLLFCRGNSFIYAGGAWNAYTEIKAIESLKDYEDTLKIFYNLIRPGRFIYVDKFKDTETTHREKVGQIKVGNNEPEDLIFWTERDITNKVRRASMIRSCNGVEKITPNITYDLSENELLNMLAKVGFKNVEKINLEGEDNFDVWLAQK